MFRTLISDASGFLRSLALNNTRDWFHAHKSDYTPNCATPPKRCLKKCRRALER